ncbi:hypothetical protein [Streptomyces sp. NPDC058861]|uniref:hypothetical protein n=1 Tax=Streptomyces sp. NPDC058861 TaxID=3346653 RepID=UPI0036932F20
MRTCDRFGRIKSGFERDIRFQLGHAERHEGSGPAKASAGLAKAMRVNMARALSIHYSKCRLCRR